MRAKRFLPLLILSALALNAFGQDPTTLIMEDDEPEIKVRVRPRETPSPDVTAAPTPNPNDVIVGIVNLHVLTLADLEARTERRYTEIRQDVLERYGGVIGTFGGLESEDVLAEEASDDGLLDEQRVQLEAAMRREKGMELRSWVEHYMLADEARRQGVAVSQGDFQERLAEAERESELETSDVDAALRSLQMTRQDYERSVYDALMIERLLDRFISINYTEAMYQAAYDQQPSLFHLPKRYRIAHFTIVLQADETKRGINVLKKKAEEVQDLMADGANPEEVFAKSEYDNIESGFYGSMPGWFQLNNKTLRPAVAAEIGKMEPGETSKVITQFIRRDGEVVPMSYHVVKLLDIAPAITTFEESKPIIHDHMLEIARRELLERLYETKTHRVVTNLRGIPPTKIPEQEELLRQNAQAEPISLKLPAGSS